MVQQCIFSADTDRRAWMFLISGAVILAERIWTQTGQELQCVHAAANNTETKAATLQTEGRCISQERDQILVLPYQPQNGVERARCIKP
jgi:hypothetical protein